MPQLTTRQFGSVYEVGSVFLELDQAFERADYTKEMAETSADLERQEYGMFAGEHDSSGSPWPKLAPATVAQKGHDQILYEHGPLGESLFSNTGDAIRTPMERGLTFGTSTPYALFHQEGTSRMPARPPVGISEETIDRLVERVANAVVEKLRG
jgi:hypothetical protein